MSDYSKLGNEVDAVADEIWDLAQHVWEFAELGFGETKSSAYASAMLEKHGFAIGDRGIGGLDTSWIATWGSGSPTIGILVEYDALPGLGNDTKPTKTPAPSGNTNGHGCGHNLICSTSIGAAIALRTHMDKEEIPGTMKVFGCPAEEKMTGKNYMAQAGAFQGLDACLHNHPGPLNTVWNFHSTAMVDLIVEWNGVTAHAGQAPWQGRSALHAVEIFLVAANMMREQMLPTARLHYQILEGGTAVNVIPDYAKVLIRYRGPSAENVTEYKNWLIDMAKGAALSTQTTETVTLITGTLDVVGNDPLAENMYGHMQRYFPIEWTDDEQVYAKAIQKEMDLPETGMATAMAGMPTSKVEVGGSSDVGDVSWNVPTMGVVHAAWPQGISPHQWGCTACHGMSIGHKATIQAAKTMAATGLDLLTQPALIKAAWQDFKKQTKGQPYKSLNELPKPPGGQMLPDERSHYECCIHGALEHFGIEEPV
ncbi:amidohydrolase [Mycobacterium sp. Y57]|uniref:amidohydrolase n=1 Tax=Mycolicibacterium xanthum TaxID=2796469 RepID=UPI001C841992|nr:amidohydrolase [Mycolicibacterium xanthum]MBX7433680.1 amidohydrolase [Mycolicibacterium xanthum]